MNDALSFEPLAFAFDARGSKAKNGAVDNSDNVTAF